MPAPTSTSGTLVLCLLAGALARVYYVETTGLDEAGRDGRSLAAAWRTMAYACERVSGPGDTILLGAGTFVETRPATARSGLTVLGRDTSRTRVQGAGTWQLSGSPRDVENNQANYLLTARDARNITVAGIAFSSADTTRRLNGALWFHGCDTVEIRECSFTEFFWDGACLMRSGNIRLHHCVFHNASLQRDSWSGGQILVRWIRDSQFHHNRLTRDKGDGYGYKAQDAGHRNVRIHDNFIGDHYFAIESAHDQEYNLEICYNEIYGCISVPKYMGGPTDLGPGVAYAVRIHHNIMHDSYGIEGPRNHLIVDSNYVFITKVGGRFYTQHANSHCEGPVWIRHNVIVNVDRGFVWAHNTGAAKNFHICNNTVFCADAGSRTEAVLAIPDTAENWRFVNNIVIAPAERPRALFNSAAKASRWVTATHNVVVNVSGAPAGNWSDVDPGLGLAGEIPYPYYAPAGAGSFVVCRGNDVGLPFSGPAPTIGAYEYTGAPTARNARAAVHAAGATRAGPPVFAVDLRGRLISDARFSAVMIPGSAALAPWRPGAATTVPAPVR